jgi:hypothetical protein
VSGGGYDDDGRWIWNDGPLTPEEIADLEWESGFSLAEQQLETELAEMQATTQRLNRLARKRSRGTGGRA